MYVEDVDAQFERVGPWCPSGVKPRTPMGDTPLPMLDRRFEGLATTDQQGGGRL